jgi:hypothetical protein
VIFLFFAFCTAVKILNDRKFLLHLKWRCPNDHTPCGRHTGVHSFMGIKGAVHDWPRRPTVFCVLQIA